MPNKHAKWEKKVLGFIITQFLFKNKFISKLRGKKSVKYKVDKSKSHGTED